MSGYRHASYARSLAEFGTPRELARSGGWILERPIDDPETDADGGAHDAMGCYPLFVCSDWNALGADLDEMASPRSSAGTAGRTPLVSLALVADPFGNHDRRTLERCFADLVVPFKEHHVIDLERAPDTFVSRHHRKHARRALRELSVTVCNDPPACLDDWMALHAELVARHHIEGMRAFSRAAFAAQLTVPGAVVLRADMAGRPVGAQLWMVDGDVAYGHVLACSDAGYDHGAAYALYWSAIEHFAGKVRYCDIGAVPGAGDDAGGSGTDGLAQFKQGWSTHTRTAYLCGRIFDQDRYHELTRARGAQASPYFPAYRAGELTAAASAVSAVSHAAPMP